MRPCSRARFWELRRLAVRVDLTQTAVTRLLERFDLVETDRSLYRRDIGEPTQAIALSTVALRDYEPWRVRNRCWIQADLGSAHLLDGDLEQAAALGRDALRTAADVSSLRLPGRLRTLQRQVHPLRCASPHLADLDDRITNFLTRTTPRPHDDNAL